ncbi:Hypothetical protein I596_1124 [Dokdonella koreensis DS-123]|uniref:Uncharacterized protein n=1 Tax=Dokdonella koreensis DS-123 TaxID=1300342 RepID=A0A160DSQ9_9GAMM|nr:Hypothetical protein I596_1124 [Dokdonella koreensis DS-123]
MTDRRPRATAPRRGLRRCGAVVRPDASAPRAAPSEEIP